VLPGKVMIASIQKNALFAARIVDNATSNFTAVRAVYDDRAYGVRSVVDSNGEGHRLQL
jgi:hypothetical protein